jgi:hypothetical protein
VAGEGQIITGSGHPTDPYIITNTGIRGALTVADTPTVDLSLFGNGVAADPYLITAATKIRLFRDMQDMKAGETADPGDTIIVNSDGTFRFGPPPVAPAGAVNVSNGITGVGSAVTPLALAVSGVWGSGPLAGLGSDSTIGTAVYVDSAGQVRSAPFQAGAVTWDSISDKPASYPSSWDQVTSKPQYFPAQWTGITGKPVYYPTSWNLIENLPVYSTLDGRTLFTNDLSPTSTQGKNGDLWFEF